MTRTVTKKAVKRVITKGLTGWGAGKLVLQDFIDSYHNRDSTFNRPFQRILDINAYCRIPVCLPASSLPCLRQNWGRGSSRHQPYQICIGIDTASLSDAFFNTLLSLILCNSSTYRLKQSKDSDLSMRKLNIKLPIMVIFDLFSPEVENYGGLSYGLQAYWNWLRLPRGS